MDDDRRWETLIDVAAWLDYEGIIVGCTPDALATNLDAWKAVRVDG